MKKYLKWGAAIGLTICLPIVVLAIVTFSDWTQFSTIFGGSNAIQQNNKNIKYSDGEYTIQSFEGYNFGFTQIDSEIATVELGAGIGGAESENQYLPVFVGTQYVYGMTKSNIPLQFKLKSDTGWTSFSNNLDTVVTIVGMTVDNNIWKETGKSISVIGQHSKNIYYFNLYSGQTIYAIGRFDAEANSIQTLTTTQYTQYNDIYTFVIENTGGAPLLYTVTYTNRYRLYKISTGELVDSSDTESFVYNVYGPKIYHNYTDGMFVYDAANVKQAYTEGAGCAATSSLRYRIIGDELGDFISGEQDANNFYYTCKINTTNYEIVSGITNQASGMDYMGWSKTGGYILSTTTDY